MCNSQNQRAALVTGASRGIGRAIAELLGQEGFALTLTSRQPDTLAAAERGLTDKGYVVQTVAGDVADDADIARIVAQHRERYGRLDVLVNNAGIAYLLKVDEQDNEHLDRMMDVNLRSMM